MLLGGVGSPTGLPVRHGLGADMPHLLRVVGLGAPRSRSALRVRAGFSLVEPETDGALSEGGDEVLQGKEGNPM